MKTVHKKQTNLSPQCVNTAVSSREVGGNNVDDQQISQNKWHPPNNSRVNECGIHCLNTANTYVARNQSSQERINTLIIGSSILTDIKTKGLNWNTDTSTNHGAGTKQIRKKLSQMDMRCYENVIVYIGENDVANGHLISEISEDIRSLVHDLKVNKCKIHLCSLCPRKDAQMIQLNNCTKQITEERSVSFIDIHTCFVYGDGGVVNQYFMQDGIHLNMRGTSAFVHCINLCVPITKIHHTLDTSTRVNNMDRGLYRVDWGQQGTDHS